MATRNIKKKVEQPSFPSDPFELMMRSKLIELINVKQTHEQRWGVERIIGLVDAEFRAKVWQQNERIYTAQQQRDEVRLVKAVDGMKKAYGALDAWAVENKVREAPSIKHCQHLMADGSIMVVVETYEDALLFEQGMGGDSKRHIWCMEELELVMNAEVIKETMALKRQHPSAQMVRLDKPPTKFPKGGATGLDDMESDGGVLKGSRMAKVFEAPVKVARFNYKVL